MDTSLLQFWVSVLLIAGSGSGDAGPLMPSRLRVEYMDRPLGIDVAQPRFSWALRHSDRAERQTAYELTIMKWQSAQPGGLGAVEKSLQWAARQSVEVDGLVAMLEGESLASVHWASGWVESNESTNVPYSGSPALESDTVYTWSVSYRDSKGVASPAGSSLFSTGLLAAADWSGAAWLDGEQGNQLRTKFTVDPKANIDQFSSETSFGTSFCYVAGLGYYTLHINGRLVSDHVLGPFTTFEERLPYYTHDVSEYLRFGDNAIAVTLGHGWYSQKSVNVGGRSLLLKCRAHFGDGTSMDIVSSTSWKQTPGPIVADDIYMGQTFNASMETPLWETAPFNDSAWPSAAVVSNTPTGALSWPAIQPIRRTRSYAAIKLTEPAPGVFVFDFGQNMAGICALTIDSPGEPGSNITLLHAEIMSRDGFVHHHYPNSAELTTYIFGSEWHGPVTIEPKFVYSGFRYVQMTGFPGTPSLTQTLVAHFVHTDMEMSGNIQFSPDDHILNSVQHITRAASLSNFIDIPTDCPQRERRGWLGDAQLSAETTLNNFDMGASYTKFMRDIQDSQIQIAKATPKIAGAVPDCVPWYHHGGAPADPAWGVAYTLIWKWMYDYYGDDRMLATYYDGVAQHMEQLIAESNHSSGLLDFSRYGDWCSLQHGGGCRKNSAMVSSFYFILQMDALSEAASILGKEDDATKYATLGRTTRAAFQTAFFDATLKTYVAENLEPQTSVSLALFLGVVPAEDLQAVLGSLVDDIVTTHQYHMNTGIVGTKYLLPMLSQSGHHDVAMALASQTTFPSWGYMVMETATTLWESWKGDEFNAVSSRNHIMFGGQSSWYYQYIAGLNVAPGSTGWKRIVVAPYIAPAIPGAGGDLHGVDATIITSRGTLRSAWVSPSPMACATGSENEEVTLACGDPNGVITDIVFASYGTPLGSCGNFSIFNCSSNNSVATVKRLCVGKHRCSVTASSTVFGGDPCFDVRKSIAIQATCSVSDPYSLSVTIPVGSTAAVRLPLLKGTTSQQWSVNEGVTVVWKGNAFVPGDPGVLSGSATAGFIEFAVGSGDYVFRLLAEK